MWFAKWFGGRKVEMDDDEPARFPVVHVDRPARDNTTTSASTPVAPTNATKGKKGFDPYNSGAFERRNAWSKVRHR